MSHLSNSQIYSDFPRSEGADSADAAATDQPRASATAQRICSARNGATRSKSGPMILDDELPAGTRYRFSHRF